MGAASVQSRSNQTIPTSTGRTLQRRTLSACNLFFDTLGIHKTKKYLKTNFYILFTGTVYSVQNYSTKIFLKWWRNCARNVLPSVWRHRVWEATIFSVSFYRHIYSYIWIYFYLFAFCLKVKYGCLSCLVLLIYYLFETAALWLRSANGITWGKPYYCDFFCFADASFSIFSLIFLATLISWYIALKRATLNL